MQPVTIPPDRPYAARAVERAGLRIIRRDGAWLAEEGAQSIIDAHDSHADALADRLEALQAEAERRIGRQAPLWRQSDLTLRLVRLLCIRGGVGVTARQLTPDEQQDAQQIIARLQRMIDVRQARAAIEARLRTLTDVWQVIGFDVTTAPEWPGEDDGAAGR